jgi:hypothetical protein
VRTDILKYAVILFVIAGYLQSIQAQEIKAVRDPDSARVLSIKKARDLPEGDLADKLEKDARGKSTLTESPDKIRQAFVFCVPSGSKEVPSCVHRVFITDLGTDETYEITGEELSIEANRPVDNLKWISNFILSYERWTNPHFGHRYVVDLKQMRQTSAYILSDR